MDGNNRWSKKNSQSKIKSYSKGAEKLLTISKKIFENNNIEYISAFALSNNNLNRNKSLIDILKKILTDFLNDEESVLKLNFQIIFLGDLKFVGKYLNKKILKIQDINRSKKQKLIIFLNYSGRKDINLFYAKNINSSFFNPNLISKHLLTKNIPDPEILIRTGGYQRISDFMLYQIAFTELFFLKKLWPDISHTDVSKIINNYKLIKRKFGL